MTTKKIEEILVRLWTNSMEEYWGGREDEEVKETIRNTARLTAEEIFKELEKDYPCPTCKTEHGDSEGNNAEGWCIDIPKLKAKYLGKEKT